jgi:hypothetical protein
MGIQGFSANESVDVSLQPIELGLCGLTQNLAATGLLCLFAAVSRETVESEHTEARLALICA